MISLENFSFTHDGAESPTLKHLNLSYEQGEFALICGPTGAGKSTLLQVFNGLVPHFTAGSISGKVRINHTDYTLRLPHDFAAKVGFVSQQAENSFVADRVDEELAFGMEQLGRSVEEMAERIDQVAETLGIRDLLNSNLTELSGGQQQRVAIAAAIAAGQKILLLDEPTSELDPASAHELLLQLRDLSHKHGYTVLIAEHRIERAIDLVDSITVVHGDGSATKANNPHLELLLQNYRMVPPVIELGQALALQPLPLTVAQARKHGIKISSAAQTNASGETLLKVESLSVKYGNQIAVHNADLELKQNQILGLMGKNGSGKSSLLWAIREQNPELVTLLPQTASDLLIFSSVKDELSDSDREAEIQPGSTAKLLTELSQRLDPKRHPRDLSAGQQLSLVLAIQLSSQRKVLLLDEPTRGLDYQAKKQLALQLELLKAERAILLASHDVEFLALVADQVIEIDAGIVSAPQPPQQALGSLGELAPQIWQVTKSALTVQEVLERRSTT